MDSRKKEVLSGTCPAARHIDPLGQAGSFLALDVDNIRIAAAAAAHAVLLFRVPQVPVLVLFHSLLLIQRRLFQPRLAGELARGGVRRAVLDGRVPVAKVSKVVDVPRGEEGSCSQRVNWRISPL